ncbi:MAG TPA: response regulator [Candidatus Pelethocola excrementipullorum]|nr:response regulator [Candidatus Pelethocola excrementipullorum]
MYRVFIADDNELARQALKKSICWEALNCEFCGEATNGNEAMELIRRELPDIVLMDIKMPGMFGMDVIASLQDLSYHTIYIMVTAYNDFEFMRKGMQIGVFDYVLKPVSDQELHTVLQKAVKHIGELRKKERDTQEIKKRNEIYQTALKENEKELEEKLFHDAINGLEHSADRLADLLRKKYHIHDYLLMLVIPETDMDSGKIHQFLKNQNEINEECSKTYPVYVKGIWRKEGYVLFMSFKQSMFMKEYNILSIRIAQMIQKKNEEWGCQVYVTISHTSSSIVNIGHLFGQTLFCKNGRFFLENKNIIHYDSICSASVSGEYIKMKKLEELYAACRDKQENIVVCMEGFLEQFVSNEIYNISYVKNIMIQAVMMMIYFLRESHPDNNDFDDVNRYVQELTKMDSLQNTYSWMMEFARRIQQVTSIDRYISSQTRKMLDYLMIHYSEPVTLQELADYMGLSGTHVSRLLKKEIGETFITCLNKIRIKESVRLLKMGQYKVYEIAEMVGYSNYAYFYQIFKKSMGVSPKDYV